MKRIGNAFRAAVHAITAPLRWWRALEPAERIFYRGLVLLSTGLGVVWPPGALIGAGSLFLAVYFGFDLRRKD